MKLLLVGAENALGQKITPLLTEHNHDLWVLLNDSVHQEMYRQMGAHVIVGDITTNGRWIDSVPVGLDVVLNLTLPEYKKHLSTKIIENEIAPQMLRIGQNLTYIATHRQSARLIQIANIFYYSQRGTAELSERSPHDSAPDNYGLIYRSLLSHLQNTKEITSTICVTGHYIYDSAGVTIPKIPRVMDKKFVTCGTGENEIHLSHIDDVVGGIVHVLENRIQDPVINIVDNKPILQRDFIKLLSHVHKAGSPLTVPFSIAAFLFGDAYPKSITQSIVLKNNLLRDSEYWLKFPDYTAGFATHLLR